MTPGRYPRAPLRAAGTFTYNRGVPSQPRRCPPSPLRSLRGAGRWRGRAGLLLAAALTLGGCKDKEGAKAAPDPAALRAQQALIARRDALLASRKQTQEERKRVQEEMRKAAASGGDTAEMQNKLDQLDSQLEVQNDQLADELVTLSTKIDSIAVASDQSAGIAAREADMGSREERLAAREERVAAREAKVAERERAAALECAVAPAVVVQPAPMKSTYSRKEIDSALSRARSAMGRRGIINSDLPSHAQGLEREATGAMAEGDMGKAYLAATQLGSIVEGLKIDGTFIKNKIARLQSRITAKGGKLDDATNKSMGAGIADVMQKWGDGDFGKANVKLNQLWNALD